MFLKIQGDLISASCVETILRNENNAIVINTSHGSYAYRFDCEEMRDDMMQRIEKALKALVDIVEIDSMLLKK